MADQYTRFCKSTNLFIDDWLIEASEGLDSITHQPEKYPEPVLRKEEDWHLQPQWFMEVKYDPEKDIFRTWYNLKNPEHTPSICYAYAESRDGVHWYRPGLGLVEACGSKNNNILDAPFRNFGLFLVDQGEKCEDPRRRYMMAYFDQRQSPEKNGMCIAFSPDGFTFKNHEGNPVIPQSRRSADHPEQGHINIISDIIDGCKDPLKDEYLVGCKIEKSGFPGKPHFHAEGWRRCVGMTTSSDFINWTDPVLIVQPDPNNGIEEFYGFKPTVRGNLYFGFLRVLRDDLSADPGGPVEGIGWTELLTSRDGINWIRHPEAFIDRNKEPGTWDHAMAWYAAGISVDDLEYIYYGGYSSGHKIGDRQVGLAVLRKNGFVSRSAGSSDAILRTYPSILPSDALTVNACIKGELRVRLIDEDGRALPGLDWKDCIPVSGDSVSHSISWNSGSALPRDKKVRLEFILRDTDLYGFDFI